MQLQALYYATSEIYKTSPQDEIARQQSYALLRNDPLSDLRNLLFKSDVPVLIIIDEIDRYPKEVITTVLEFIVPKAAKRVSFVYSSTEEKRFSPFTLYKHKNNVLPDWESQESKMDGVTLFKHIESVLGELPPYLDKSKMFIYLRGLSLFDRFRESEVNHWLLNYDPEMEEAQKFPPHKHLYSHEHPYNEYFMHLKGAGLIRWNTNNNRYEIDHGLAHAVGGFLGITLPETLKSDNMIISEFYSGCAVEYKRHHKYYTELRLHHLRIALGIDDEPDDNGEWLSR